MEKFKNFKKIYNKNGNIDKLLKTNDSYNIIGSTNTSIKVNLTGCGLKVVKLTAGVVCGDAITTKLAGEFLQKKNLHRIRNTYRQQSEIFKECQKS